ncbi:retrotransposon-related protein [Tanacetum coccineum]
MLSRAKCTFLVPQVKYLGHVLSAQGVATDPLKIQAMAFWPIPTTRKQLRGFLGLTGYYRRFIKNYAIISQPLTKLLRKNGFHWSTEAEVAFNQLKHAMTNTPILALPNFEKEFMVEIDASGSVMMALERWRGYLLDRHFKIKIDHFSLKYLLDQRLTTPFQTKWLPKLLSFDYEISYKKGADNRAANALLRCPELNAITTTTITTDLLKRTQDSWIQDKSLHSLIQKLQVNPNTPSKFKWKSNQLTRRGGHSEVNVTLQNLKDMVYWKGMRKWVKNKVKSYDVCQRNKLNLSANPGYLQPLPIPPIIWSSISMDFIKGFPSSQGKTVIFFVVDRLSKYAHFMALHHSFTASKVAQVFMDNVFKLHGLPHDRYG